MKRVFWIALGASAGVLIARQVRSSMQQLTPDSVGSSLSSLGTSLLDRAQVFRTEVRANMAEREVELREAFGLDAAEAPTGAATTATTTLSNRPGAESGTDVPEID